MQRNGELHRSGRQDLDARGHQLSRLVGIIIDGEFAVVAFVGGSGDVQTLAKVKEDLGVPVGTLDEAVSVLDVLDGALLATLVRDFEGLVEELNFGGAGVLVAPVNRDNELDPIPVF